MSRAPKKAAAPAKRKAASRAAGKKSAKRPVRGPHAGDALLDTAAAQLRRLLHLIPRLADGHSHSVAELARQIDTSPKQLLADLQSLTDRYDVPGGFIEGVSVLWDGEKVSAMAPHFLRPMRLSMGELCALELGLTLLRGIRPRDEWRTIDRALERVRKAISTLPSNDQFEGVHHAALEVAGQEHLVPIHKALRQRHKLRITYAPGVSGAPESRTVCPYSLVFAEGMWYLVAHCEKSEGVRFFRLDRVSAVKDLDFTYEMPEDVTRRFVTEHRMFENERPRRMTVRYAPTIAKWIVEREGAELASDGSVTVDRPFVDDEWAIRHVLQYGAQAEVLSPPELRQAVGQRLQRM